MALHQHEGHRRRHGVGRRDGGEPQLGVHDPQGGDHHPAKFHQNRPRDVLCNYKKNTAGAMVSADGMGSLTPTWCT